MKFGSASKGGMFPPLFKYDGKNEKNEEFYRGLTSVKFKQSYFVNQSYGI